MAQVRAARRAMPLIAKPPEGTELRPAGGKRVVLPA